eukprot:scaffold40283_cov65-Phaeocystis_antarctica.AAC.3
MKATTSSVPNASFTMRRLNRAVPAATRSAHEDCSRSFCVKLASTRVHEAISSRVGPDRSSRSTIARSKDVPTL